MPHARAALVVLATAAPAAAQDVTFIDGLGDMAFVTVGDPGNRGVSLSDTTYGRWATADPRYPEDGTAGSVDYSYRISQTPVTYGQWFPFIDAYSQFFNELDGPGNIGLYGAAEFDATRPGGWRPVDPRGFPIENFAIQLNLQWAAYYVNWLHNDRAMTRDAFLSGVYDASTFVIEEVDGETVFHHDFTPADDARFWLPDLNEMLKAAYYDPTSTAPNGDEGRWWHFGDQGDEPLVEGLPGEGERIGDLRDLPSGLGEVGLYSDVISYYGLLDVHDTIDQRTLEKGLFEELGGWDVGSPAGTDALLHELSGHLIVGPSQARGLGLAGFRLVAAVPSPGTAAGALVGFTLLGAARRRRSRPPRHTAHRQVAVLRP